MGKPLGRSRAGIPAAQICPLPKTASIARLVSARGCGGSSSTMCSPAHSSVPAAPANWPDSTPRGWIRIFRNGITATMKAAQPPIFTRSTRDGTSLLTVVLTTNRWSRFPSAPTAGCAPSARWMERCPVKRGRSNHQPSRPMRVRIIRGSTFDSCLGYHVNWAT